MCDGAGHCDTTPQSCSPYRGCNGNACASTCAQDSDCVGPCHVCPSGAAQLCLAPLAPVASLTAAGVACKKPLTACAPATPPTCGPAGTYGVGVEPVGIAFDGTNMWVANFMDGTVSVLSPSGMQIAGSPFQVGNGPYGIAFDGANMWITNFFDDSVSVLSAATGAQIAGSPFPVGTNPEGIAFDGANMWIVDNGGNDVTELSVATGANVGSSPYATVSGPSAIAFDGKNMWVTNAGTGTIVELNATGTPVGNSNASVGTEPFSIALDGSGHVWIADYGSDNVTKVPLVGGTPPFPSFPLPAGSAPHGIAFDGTNLWTADYGPASDHGHTVSQIAPDGTVLGTFNVGHAPNFIAFDGTHVWVTNSDDNTVTAL
jgi:DNA-binding beta-propeller fold protein YncE